MDFSMFIKPDMVGFILGVIVFIEIVKKAINSILQRETEAWIWKIVIFVVGVGAAAIDLWDSITLRQLIILGLTYAAGATLLYQTGKLVWVKAKKDEGNKGT